jgi:hypothetical protein
VSHIEPLLKPINILDLRPTQITVGQHEVDEKRQKWRGSDVKKGEKFLGSHMIPTVLGPQGRHYVIDHHHLARALHQEGVEQVLCTVVANVSALPEDSFWVYMDNKAWCHPYDASGKRVGFDQIPDSVDQLIDDPYRSLAGDLRHLGGYAKDMTPFAEFIWADFLRRRIDLDAIAADYDAAAAQAVTWAKTLEASYLPGWCGVSPIV